MNPKRITIVPFIHGKLTRDGKMSEPCIHWIIEKWLERHPMVRAIVVLIHAAILQRAE